jgi:hypothetical protein
VHLGGTPPDWDPDTDRTMTTKAPTVTDLSDRTSGWVLLAGIALLFVVAHEAILDAARDAEARHNRGELLRAYRNRRRWKASDRANLMTLNLSPAAHRRLERLAGKGRPVVEQHRELAEVMVEKLQPIAIMASKTASPNDRLRAMKALPWWPHFVESLYRGEHQLAKVRGDRSPAFAAECLVAHDLGVSQSTVHRLCGDIRRVRQACADDANFEPQTLTDLQAWLATGGDFTVWG